MLTPTMTHTYSEALKCQWSAWIADEHLPVLRLYLPEMNYCDMDGCISVATALLPHVIGIAVYTGGELANEYELKNGKWTCLTAN